MARRAKLTRQGVSLLERGYRGGHIDTLRRVAAALNVSLAEIVQ